MSCDSCGMPLKDDNRGTEAGGDASSAYCSACYADGAFTLPDGTIDDVRERAVAAMEAIGVPPHTANMLTAKMDELPRWQ